MGLQYNCVEIKLNKNMLLQIVQLFSSKSEPSSTTPNSQCHLANVTHIAFFCSKCRHSYKCRNVTMFHLRMVCQCCVVKLTGVVFTSKPKSRICSACMRQTMTQRGEPGWISSSRSWKTGAPPSPSAQPSPKTHQTCTGSTCIPRTEAASSRYVLTLNSISFQDRPGNF